MTPAVRRSPVAAAAAALALAGCAGPSARFDAAAVPPAPDYARSEAWLALPGRNGLERSAPAGLFPTAEDAAPADVFFIHPTTAGSRDGWNAPWEVSDAAAPLNASVLRGQASVFNGCCRIYAPRYRQATLAALGRSPEAVDLAYADVSAAFRAFIARRDRNRPFILASHSQGTMHAIRLLQEEILGRPLQAQLVAAYLIGGYVPDAFPEIGLPICDAADQTGCVLTWNAGKIGSLTARIVIHDKTYWWRGAPKSADQAPAVCVNPLTWRAQRPGDPTAPADLNSGSLPLPRAPVPTGATPLPPLTPHLTGARCRDGMLEIDIPADAPSEYGDPLTRMLGSYHLNDYGLFYGVLRDNTLRRVAAWTSAHPARHGDF